MSASLFYQLYDPTPVIDVDDPAVIETLRAHMQAVLATYGRQGPSARLNAIRTPPTTFQAQSTEGS